ncbi:nitrous oxide-stimulated promoter family protein [Candidatus Poribacteria bacterium]|nr:nitrous oxide-stimulated promoter family protein [Candidatus Poribacteria bacterium]
MDKQENDKYILEQFISIYCRGNHKTPKAKLCSDCQKILEYSLKRLERCPQDPKPSCKNCEIHCYKPEYREKIRQVMRYSGKHLILRGRLDLLWHYFT